MSSTKAPYATLHDLPKFEKRSDVVSAPWLKDDIAPFNCGRGASPDCYIPSNSQTAPFATFHNQPHHHEVIGIPSLLPPYGFMIHTITF
jgi:hypothetical protein